MKNKQQDRLEELLKIFAEVIEASKGTIAGNDDRILDAEGLAIKFFSHASAALYLYQGTNLPTLGANFIDPASINVIGRAALETFLVFHYVFVGPTSDDERDFRYSSWMLAGILERQKLPARSPKGKEVLSKEAQLVDPLRKKLTNNQFFQTLKPGEQKGVLGGRKWRLNSWKDMAIRAGLSQIHAEAFYGYLCGYAHAGNLSVLQIRSARTLNDQHTLCAATINVLLIATANMINAYRAVFQKSDVFFQKHNNWAALVDLWVNIGATPTAKVKIDWDQVGLGI